MAEERRGVAYGCRNRGKGWDGPGGLLKRDDLDVEVFDLDIPVYVTAEEQFDFEQKENQVKEIVESPEWRCAW